MRPSDSPSRPPCRMPNGSPLRRDGCDNRFPPTGGTNSKDYQSHSHVSRLLFLYRPSLRQSVFRPAHESLHLLPVAIVTSETTGFLLSRGSQQRQITADHRHLRLTAEGGQILQGPADLLHPFGFGYGSFRLVVVKGIFQMLPRGTVMLISYSFTGEECSSNRQI